VFNRDFRGARTAGDERWLAAAADGMGASLLGLREKANAQGLADMGVAPGWLPGYRPVADAAALEAVEKAWGATLGDLAAPADVAAALRARKIKVVLVLGEDPLGAPGFPEDLKAALRAVPLLIVADALPTATVEAAHVALPLSLSAETSGTFTNSERRVQRLERAIPPAGGVEGWELLGALAAKLGHRLHWKYGSTAEVFEEIRQVAAIYRNVDPARDRGDGVWPAAAAGLARVGPGPDGAAPFQPVPTLALDAVEARFAAWFDAKMAQAGAPDA
jgi:predicted molibdopterin-dependent oxidoreductase YjgC